VTPWTDPRDRARSSPARKTAVILPHRRSLAAALIGSRRILSAGLRRADQRNVQQSGSVIGQCPHNRGTRLTPLDMTDCKTHSRPEWRSRMIRNEKADLRRMPARCFVPLKRNRKSDPTGIRFLSRGGNRIEYFQSGKLFKASFISTHEPRRLGIIASRLFCLDADRRKC
jgi:hypothetical protein